MQYRRKEKLYYTIIICALMEFLMAYYNYFFHTSAFLHEAFLLACIEFIPAFIIGCICESFIVSRVAYKTSFFLRKRNYSEERISQINKLLIAIGMMIVISIYGAFLHSSTVSQLLPLIGKDFIKNSIFGIPLFFFVVDPLTRYIIRRLKV